MAKEKNKTELPTVMEGELKARLIKLREDAGLDTAQLATAMCLSEDTIINLENEAFDDLAEPPYVRGYLRNYAKLGEENPEELINRYESLRGADASELDFHIKSSTPIETIQPKRISPIWGQVILLGILIGAIALIFNIPSVKNWAGNTWDSFSTQLQPTDASNNPSLLGDLPVPVPLPEDEIIPAKAASEAMTATDTATDTATSNPEQNTNTGKTAADPDPTKSVNNADTPKVADETTAETAKATANNTTTETESTAENSSQTTTQDSAATDSNQLIDIKLVFNKEVWLRIKDKDNKTVFEGLNKAATDKSLSLEKPLTFRVGNAQGLAMLIDGKAVDISTYINGSIANFTLE